MNFLGLLPARTGIYACVFGILLALLAANGAKAQAPAAPDMSQHKVRFITVARNVKLEVLDWGGKGRPLIFLAGAGDTAHVFDNFAPKFTGSYHAYGITRRGSGASGNPDPATSDYSSDRLGDDVLAVMDALKLDRPVLAGHSFAGEELSSIGSRYPKKVAGLVYLDAAYAYAYYAPGNLVPVGDNLIIDANNLRMKLFGLTASGVPAQQSSAAIAELLRTDLPDLRTDLLATQKALQQSGRPLGPPIPASPCVLKGCGLLAGAQKYTNLKAPVLAIFAVPAVPANASAAMRAKQGRDDPMEAQINRFEAGNPSARVVLLQNGNHEVFISNQADVLREMKVFMATLK